jgi:hypothetical protein
MAGRPSCRLWLDAAKAQPGQIKLIDKNFDRPDRIVPRSLLGATGADRILALRLPFFEMGALSDRLVSSTPE